MKQFSPKLFFIFSFFLFLSYCSDPVKVGSGTADISINAAWISDYVDEDADGYYSYANIYFEVTTSKDVDVTFMVKYKINGNSSYSTYKETSEFSISGTETRYVSLGSAGFELPQGCYDFRIEVYSAGEMLASLSAEEETDIGTFCMETPEDEMAVVTFNNAWIADDIDDDGDGYHSFANIYFDITTSKQTDVVFVIKYKVNGTSTYSVYKQTSQNTISGTSTWYVALGNSGFELPHDCYDFSIEIYSSSILLASITAQQNSNIASFCMETPEDETASVAINDAWINDLNDIDANGYNSSANIYFEISASEAIDVYFVVKYKLNNESTYNVYKQTSEINISGTSTWFISLGNSGYELPYGCYDFSVEVYSSSTLLTSINAQQDNSIASFCMETPEEDYINLKLNNTTYTVMEITVVNYGTQTVNPGESAVYNFSEYPGNMQILASTSGKTTSNTQVGLLFSWDFYHDMTGDYETDLIITSDYFFMRLRNAGPVDFSPIYVNWEKADQTVDNIIIPNNNVNYNTGYYRAYSDTEVRAYYNDDSGTFIYWLPASLYSGENNQLVELWWEGAGFGKQGVTENWEMPQASEQLPVPQFMIKEAHKTKYLNPEYGVAR